MRLQARLLEAPRLARRLRLLAETRRLAVAAAVAEGAEALRDEVRLSLSQAGPSGPGEAPARRSGRLAASVTAETATDGLSAEVGSDLDYGRHLEFGTRRLAARPWLLPAFHRMAPGIARRLLAAGRGEL